ncbi:hypothetical protein ACWDOR_43125 [Streptosporangium canum]
MVVGVERLGRVGNLAGGVAAEAPDAGVRPSTASASMEMPWFDEFGGVGVAELGEQQFLS